MRNFDVHVCLVSKQPLPNLIPILVSDPKPKEVILLVSHEMNERAGWLETVLKTYHIHVSKVSIADSYDKEALENQMLDLKLFENYTSQNILMNITGGTKLMAISAYSVFSANDSVCAYFVERSNELVYLDQAGQKFVLEPKLKIKDILLAHGYELVGKPLQQLPMNKPHLTRELVQGDFGSAISAINGVISDKKLTADFPEKGDKERIKTVLDKFEREGLLQYDLQQITFTDKAALKYVHGGWLEEHVLSAVKDIKGLQDYALGGEIIKLGATASKQKQDGKADNELDVIVLMNNILHIIECKTVNYTSLFNKGEGNNVIYRLQAFQEQELGGLKTKVALVSYRDLDEPTKKRAKDNQIPCYESRNIVNLKNNLEAWLKK